jgi:hypothetical protein
MDNLQSSLHPDHFKDLRRSGLKDQILQAAGIYSVPPCDISKKLEGRFTKVESLLSFPYPGADGYERVAEGFSERSDRPFHPALLVARPGVAQADFDVVMAGELQKARIILDLWPTLGHYGSEVIVADGVRDSPEGAKGHLMPLDKELEGAAGEEMGEQIPREAQERDEGVEFSQLGMMEKTPIGLGFFPR